MALTRAEEERIVQLGEGSIQPENGMEKHFGTVTK